MFNTAQNDNLTFYYSYKEELLSKDITFLTITLFSGCGLSILEITVIEASKQGMTHNF